MVVIGVVLLVLAALGVAAVAWTGRDVDVRLDGFGVHVTISALGLFIAGAVAMLLLVLAWGAFRRAARNWRAERRAAKAERAERAARERESLSESKAESKSGAGAELGSAEREVDLRGGADERTAAHGSSDHDPAMERRYLPDEDRDR